MPGRTGPGSRRCCRSGRGRGRGLRCGRWRRQEPRCSRGRCRRGIRGLGGAMPRHQGATDDQRDRDDREHQYRGVPRRHHQQAEGNRDGDQAEYPRIPDRFRHPQHRGRRPGGRAPAPVDEQARAEHDEHRRQRHPKRDAVARDPGEDDRDGRHRRHRNPGGPGQPFTQPTGRPQHRGPEIPGQHGPGRSGQQRADQVRYHETPPNVRSGPGTCSARQPTSTEEDAPYLMRSSLRRVRFYLPLCAVRNPPPRSRPASAVRPPFRTHPTAVRGPPSPRPAPPPLVIMAM